MTHDKWRNSYIGSRNAGCAKNE